MYLDFSNTNRNDFQFTYTGGELLPFARTKLASVAADEVSARGRMADMLRDMRVNVQSDKCRELEKKIAHLAEQHEKLRVWVHEFARRPEAEYKLHAGDVVYFGIAE